MTLCEAGGSISAFKVRVNIDSFPDVPDRTGLARTGQTPPGGSKWDMNVHSSRRKREIADSMTCEGLLRKYFSNILYQVKRTWCVNLTVLLAPRNFPESTCWK